MSVELSELEFSLDDVVGGRPLTPATVDLPTLRGFLEEVEKLIKGDMTGASLRTPDLPWNYPEPIWR